MTLAITVFLVSLFVFCTVVLGCLSACGAFDRKEK